MPQGYTLKPKGNQSQTANQALTYSQSIISLLHFHLLSVSLSPASIGGALLPFPVWCCSTGINFCSNKLFASIYLLTYLINAIKLEYIYIEHWKEQGLLYQAPDPVQESPLGLQYQKRHTSQVCLFYQLQFERLFLRQCKMWFLINATYFALGAKQNRSTF